MCSLVEMACQLKVTDAFATECDIVLFGSNGCNNLSKSRSLFEEFMINSARNLNNFSLETTHKSFEMFPRKSFSEMFYVLKSLVVIVSKQKRERP